MKYTVLVSILVFSFLWTSANSFSYGEPEVPEYIYRTVAGSGPLNPLLTRKDFGMAVLNDDILILGGVQSDHPTVATTDSWLLNTKNFSWSPFGVTLDLHGHCVAQNGSLVYIFGGQGTTSNRMSLLNLTDGSLITFPATPPDGHAMYSSCGIYEDKVIIFGGCSLGNLSQCTSNIIFFNASQKEPNFWEPKVSGVPPLSSKGSSLAVITVEELTKKKFEKESYVVVFGGEQPATQNGFLFIFHLEHFNWTSKEFSSPLHTAYQTAIATESNIILSFGGIDSRTRELNDDTYAITLDGNVTRLNTTDRPFPRKGHGTIYTKKTVIIYGGDGPTIESASDIWQLVVEAECSSKTCGECILSHHCVWCNPTGTPHCVVGDESPYLGNSTCPSNSWYYKPASCRVHHKAPTWLVAVTIVILILIVIIVVATYLVDWKKGKSSRERYEPI